MWRIGNKKGEIRSKCEVLQESILSPILFIIYTNDLNHDIAYNISKIVSYTYDAIFLIKTNSFSEMVEYVNRCYSNH